MSHFSAMDAKEREEVYRDLVKSKRPIQIQIQGERIKQGKILSREKGQLYFNLPFIHRFEATQMAIVTFSLPPDVFFLKTKVVSHLGKYYFEETKDIYRLQRRDTFRLSVPDIIEAEVKFEDASVFRLHDISQGGFGIELPAKKASSFTAGEKLKVEIVLMGEKFEGVVCESKHGRVQKTNPQKVIVGFQFLKLGARREQMLFRLITDIARTHFR